MWIFKLYFSTWIKRLWITSTNRGLSSWVRRKLRSAMLLDWKILETSFLHHPQFHHLRSPMFTWSCLLSGLTQQKSGWLKLTPSSRSEVSKTKFVHAVAVLSQEVASQILDLIRAPPAKDPYEVLRECFITLYTLNDYQRFQALVSLPLSGDQKPSHLMNRMLALLPDNFKPDLILCGLFLQHLPIDVCSHLLWEKGSDPWALALKADELYRSRLSSSSMNLFLEVLEDSLQVNAVSSSARPPKAPLSRRSSTPALSSRSLTPPGACWFNKKH